MRTPNKEMICKRLEDKARPAWDDHKGSPKTQNSRCGLTQELVLPHLPSTIHLTTAAFRDCYSFLSIFK